MLLPSGILGLGLAAILVLYLGLKRDFRAQVQKQQCGIQEVAAELKNLASVPPAPVPPERDAPAEARPLRSAVNINPRIRAMRLLRGGEDPAHIASALGVTRAEAELLVRVHRIKLADFANTRHSAATN
ncbi:MAG: hypothetical protein JO307_21590 [Bryobacterales bacterium]|nr:hypothetical protein [Bryobacterales bacterium]